MPVGTGLHTAILPYTGMALYNLQSLAWDTRLSLDADVQSRPPLFRPGALTVAWGLAPVRLCLDVGTFLGLSGICPA